MSDVLSQSGSNLYSWRIVGAGSGPTQGMSLSRSSDTCSIVTMQHIQHHRLVWTRCLEVTGDPILIRGGPAFLEGGLKRFSTHTCFRMNQIALTSDQSVLLRLGSGKTMFLLLFKQQLRRISRSPKIATNENLAVI